MCSWFIRGQEHCSTYGDHFRRGGMTYGQRNICIKHTVDWLETDLLHLHHIFSLIWRISAMINEKVCQFIHVLRWTPSIAVERYEKNLLKYYKVKASLILLCWCFPTASLQLTNHAVVMSYFCDFCWFCCWNVIMNVAPGSSCQDKAQRLKAPWSEVLWLSGLSIGCSLIIRHQVHLLCSISFQFPVPVWLGVGN